MRRSGLTIGINENGVCPVVEDIYSRESTKHDKKGDRESTGRASQWKRLSVSVLRNFNARVLLDYGIVISFLFLFMGLASISPAFASLRNLLNILEQSSAIGIIACGGTLVIIAGGFDLSAGAVYAVAAVCSAMVANAFGTLPGILAAMAVGLALGTMNGIFVTGLRVNSFIATLSSSFMYRGFATLLTGGYLIMVDDPSFRIIGRGLLWGIRFPIFVLIGFALILGIVLSRTVFGEHIYAAGGNPIAARLSGVRVNRVRFTTFVLSGFSAGLSGALTASRLGVAPTNIGVGLELTAIAAIVIGGTSIMGGSGAIWRSMLGVLLLALVGNGFNIIGVNPFYQKVFQGAIIVLAVAVDALARRRD